MGFPWARYYDLTHGNPIPIPISSVILGVVRRGEVPPFGACADGPKDVSDAANERGLGGLGGNARAGQGQRPCTAKRSLVYRDYTKRR